MEKSRHSTGHHVVFGFAAVIALGFALVTATSARAACTGDCNTSSDVTVDEIIKMVNIALDPNANPVSGCTPGDANNDGAITVDEIIQAVNNALSGCPTATAFCGDHHTDAGEQCDDGGICIGGTNAGTTCAAEADCHGSGVCVGGDKAERVCTSDNDCTGGKCRHCIAFGGDGCAANCTTENTATFTFSTDSASTVHTELFGDIPLPLTGSEQVIGGNADANGNVTFVVTASSVQIPKIDVGGLACACVRGVAAKSCGGTVFEADGSQTVDCTPGFTAGDSVCPVDKPCAFINGPGNAASGTAACSDAGLEGANLNYTQDSRGSQDPAQCADQPGLGAPTCAAPAVITLSGHGAKGSAVSFNTQAIGIALGACSGAANFCTDNDPFSARGTPATAPLVTNTATGEMDNINGEDGVNLGPFSVSGAPFNCASPSTVSGVAFAGAFTAPNQATTQDIVVNSLLKAQ